MPEFKDTGSIFCRAAGLVSVSGDGGFTDYIAKALEDELSEADLFDAKSENSIRIKLKSVNFSSRLGMTHWNIRGTYTVNDKIMDISTEYEDRSSFVAVKACAYMAEYFRRAVGEHLSQLYAEKQFQDEIGIIDASQTKVVDLEQKLNNIRELLDRGVITEEEYNKKRRQLIDSY